MWKRTVCGIAGAWFVLVIIMISLHCRSERIPWYEKSAVVCHALGETEEGDTLTNSWEAFLYRYQQGQRVFEADLQITSDEVMVLRHDWGSDLGQADTFGWSEDERGAVTAREFLSAPIEGKYIPLTLEKWFEIMKYYPDVYMITDTKYSEEVESQFRLLVETAVKNDCEEVLSRVIVQIYYKEMYDEVMSVYPFENVIWTLYYTGYPGKEEVLDFMKEKNIQVLVMPASYWNGDIKNDLSDSGIKVYVHTVNDEEEAKRLIQDGVDGIYTDRISSEKVKEWLLPISPI